MIVNYIIALSLAIIVEVCVVYILGLRKPIQLLAIACINIITNPALNYLISLYQYATGSPISMSLVLLAELVVVVIEACLIIYILKEKHTRAFWLSFAMNTCSFIAGLIVFR